ncbi:hypothetical protein FACS1894211_09890 [Clostridia bacterium]|nr:hypothetical protein FACS1894211_09890 [Clostridia bacterium]
MVFEPDLNLYPAISARELHTVLGNLAVKDGEIQKGRRVFPVRDCKRFIGRNHKKSERKAEREESFDEFEKWLYENDGVISDALSAIAADNKMFRKMPYADGAPRVYTFAGRVLKHADGNADAEWIRGAVAAYQREKRFDYRELLYLPLAFRCAAVEWICALILRYREIARSKPATPPPVDGTPPPEGNSQKDESDNRQSVVVRSQRKPNALLKNKYTLSLSACINFLRKIEELLPYADLRAWCASDGILRGERSGVYRAMREETCGDYLDFLARFARRRNLNEDDVARAAVESADEAFAAGIGAPANHCGYWFFRERGALVRRLKEVEPAVPRKSLLSTKSRFFQLLYIVPNYVIAAALSLAASALVPAGWPRLIYAVIAYPIFVYIAKLITTGVLKIFTRPDVLPRLDFSGGVPDRHKTLVVVSQLVASEDEMRRAVRRVGVNASAEADGNIGYCLLADLPASDGENLSDKDKAIIEAGRIEWENLKKEYKHPVSLYVRKRTYNKKEKKYMGWERKRGALMDLCGHFLGKGQVNNAQCTMHNAQLKGTGNREQGTGSGQLEDKNAEKFPSDGGVSAERTGWPTNENKTDNCALRIVHCELKKGNGFFYAAFGDGDLIPVNIVALDGDTAAPPGAVLNLIETAAHPLNFKYNVFSPRIRTNPLTTEDTVFARLFANDRGFDSYSSGAFDVYQDLFHIGIFHGKGLFRMREFHDTLAETLPENRILSHDLIEGAIAGAANVRTALYDTYPPGYRPFVKRNLRWIRGDWQLMPYLLPTFITRSGKRRANPLQPLSKWQITDNLLYSLLAPCGLALIALCPFYGAAFLWPLLTGASFYLSAFLTDIYVNIKAVFHRASLPAVAKHIGAGLARLLFNLAVLPHYALCALYAIGLTLARMLFKRNLMRWETFAHTLPAKRKTRKKAEISEADGAYFLEIARETWAYFRDTLNAENRYLPCDNFQEEGGVGWARRTSPTNIGFALLAAVCARDMGFLGQEEFLELTENVLKTVRALKKYKGNLYNWYDTRTSDVLRPAYVSSVDSGNFLAALVAVRGAIVNAQCTMHNAHLKDGNSDRRSAVSGRLKDKACHSAVSEESPSAQDKGQGTRDKGQVKDDHCALEKNCASRIVHRIDELIENTDLSCLYDRKKKLFYIGYEEGARGIQDAHYDLLASEAQLLSFVAVALKKVPAETWARLSRARVRAAGGTLRSWTGGMFEYLMPRLLLDIQRGALLYAGNRNAVKSQIAFCRQERLPFFGISESQYRRFDGRGNYQYKAFGIRTVSIKNIDVHRVLSPYSVFLALGIGAEAADIRKMEAEALRGKYGFYEAIDFSDRQKGAVIRSFMAHHQGMILCAIYNRLNDGALARAFMSDFRTAGAALLLAEPEPTTRAARKKFSANIRQKSGKGSGARGRKSDGRQKESIANRERSTARTDAGAGLLTNGRFYSVFNRRGEGFLTFDGFALTRFRTLRNAGIRFSVECPDGGIVELSDLIPKAVFKDGETLFIYRARGLQITVAAAVSPAYPVEARAVRVRSRKDRDGVYKITSYFEPTLCPREEDISHPAFSELFLNTEIRRGDNAIVVTRNNARRAPALIHVAAAGEKNEAVQFEASRFNFFGRGPASPPDGFTVAPCVSIRCDMPMKNGSAEVCFLTGAAYEDRGNGDGNDNGRGNATERMIGLLNSPGFADNVFTAARREAFGAGMADGADKANTCGGAALLLEKLVADKIPDRALKGLAGREPNVRGLERLGIDLRFPVVCVRIKNAEECGDLSGITEEVKRLRGCLRFGFGVLYAEKAGYRTPLKDALREAVADTGAILVNTAEEFGETVAALEAVAIEMKTERVVVSGQWSVDG